MQLKNILSKICGLLSIACLSLFFVTCSSDSTSTDGNIVGTVTSSRTNEPLQGVLVTLSNVGKSVTTGKDGRYQFMNLSSQDYTVQVSKENYKTDSKTIFVRAGEDNTLDFSMQPSTPELELSQTQIDFGSDKTNISISIKNKGNAVLNWQIVEDIEWLSCNPSKGSLPVGSSEAVVITVDRSTLTNGEYKQSIAISSNGGDAVIDVNLVVQGMKDVEVSPDQLDFGTTTTSIELTMKNRTKGSITYSLTPSNKWIVPNKTSGTFSNNEIVTVGVDRTNLAAGDYSGKLSLKVGNQSMDIPVRMSVAQAAPPTVSLYSVDDVTYNSAKFRGAVVSIGSSKVSRHGFCWSKEQNPTLTSGQICNLGDCDKAKDIDYIASSLEPSTTYYVRTYAESSAGVGYSNPMKFVTGKTPQKPTVETGDVSNITSSNVIIVGNITNVGTEEGVTQYGHVWSTKIGPTTSSSSTQLGKTEAARSFTSNLTNLSPGQTYYVRAYATNSIGTSYGQEVTFTTATDEVVLTTTTATNILHNTATVGGNITSLGGNVITERGVCWGTSVNPVADGAHAVSSDNGNTFSVKITGLTEQTTYHVRAYVKTKENKVFYGTDVVFTTTQEITAATVAETSVSNVKSSEATFSSSVTSTGNGTISDCGFCYSTKSNPTVSDNKLSCGKHTGSFSAAVSTLNESTTYYVRAYVLNELGLNYGAVKSFATKAKEDENKSGVGREEFGEDEDWN